MLGIAPIPTLVAGTVWGLLLALSGRSSLASLTATLSLVGLCAWLLPGALPATLLLATGIAITHTPNIRRLVRGEESSVVRPVRLQRRNNDELTADEALSQGPAGGESGEW